MLELTNFLDLAVRKGMPIAALEAVGLKQLSPTGTTRWFFLGRQVELLLDDGKAAARAAAERVVVEWLGTIPYWVYPYNNAAREWSISGYQPNTGGESWPDFPTLSEALAAALEALPDAKELERKVEENTNAN